MADFIDGYRRVIEVVRARHKAKHGHEHGALAAFAVHLGVSRQTLDNWASRKGFPRKYGAKIMKFTGLRPEEIYPGVERPITFPPPVDDEIVEMSRANRQGISETVVQLVRSGLNSKGKS